jgi:RecG-like helicase
MKLQAGRLRGAWRRWSATEDELEAENLQAQVTANGCTAVRACGDRQVVRVRGVIRSVEISSQQGAPTLEIEMYDGTGVVCLIFLGRQRIAGLDTGRSLIACGRLSTSADRSVMYNPKYELLPSDEAVG